MLWGRNSVKPTRYLWAFPTVRSAIRAAARQVRGRRADRAQAVPLPTDSGTVLE